LCWFHCIKTPCGLAGTGTYASSVEIALNGVIALTQFSQIWNAASAIKFKIAFFFDHIRVFIQLSWAFAGDLWSEKPV
jgi:hypothetical protein